MAIASDDRDFVTRWLEEKASDANANQKVLKAISDHNAAANPHDNALVDLIVSLADELGKNDVVDKAH